MSPREADNVALVRQYMDDVWNEGHVELVDEYFAEDFVLHEASNESRTRTEYKETVREIRGAFPDFTVRLDDLLGDDDKVAVRITERGTHEGEYMGIDPTGREVEIHGIVIDRLEDGTVVEEWSQADVLGLLGQLGVVDTPGD